MSLHKLTAGGGYTYLTRQVAAQDATSRGRDGLASYYAQRGESPGVWLGQGAVSLGLSAAGGVVSEAQMVALFGEGRHPDADVMERQLLAAGHGLPVVLAATRLGSAYRTEAAEPAFRRRLAARFGEHSRAAGRPEKAALPDQVRAQLRTGLGREMFAEQHGRPPADARELSGFLARAGRPPAGPVAGYDLTFTPVKSVSALWAVAPLAVAEQVERAHADAVTDALSWLEEHASFTRLGGGGVRQVEVTGLIAAAFVHRDSRAGDPNLHTHVAVSNKVQVADTPAAGGQAGQWRALDGRPLHALAVAACERYNTRLEALLADRLGVRFAERPGAPAGKRAVREVVGVDVRLTAAWSSRRADIDVRRAELGARFLAEHGRVPTPVEATRLAQQATLETRQAKHEPRSHGEQRATCRVDALRVLGGDRALQAMLTAVQRDDPGARDVAGPVPAGWVADTALQVLQTVQDARATWREAHVRAEAERRARAAALPLAQVDDAVQRVVAAVLSPALSTPLGAANPAAAVTGHATDCKRLPAALLRSDGTSVYAAAGSELFTSPQVLAAERALLAAARRRDGHLVAAAAVDLAVQEAHADGRPLNAGQTALVRDLATSGARVQLALAPAGTGKTTALRALARAWTLDGGTVVGLAPSAAAAAVLGAELGRELGGDPHLGGGEVPADTLAKLVWSIGQLDAERTGPPDGQASGDGPTRSGRVPGWVRQIGPGSLVLIDEAGMAGTLGLSRAVEWVTGRGGSVRLVGDDAQLSAVGAGGVLRDLAHAQGAATLDAVVRFTDPVEGAATLALRGGDPVAVGFYLDRQRVHVGAPGSAAEQAYTAWSADRTAGLDSVLLAPTRELVTELNLRARTDRLTAATASGQPAGREVPLMDGSAASAGDRIITRRNDRRLTFGDTDWVRNGDRWTIQQVHPDGALLAVHARIRRRVVLPAGYVREHVALGYASTVHGAQGSTADTSHTVLTGSEDRQLLYVALTRGRTANHLYLAQGQALDEHTPPALDTLHPPTAAQTLTRILGRDGAQSSATSTRRQLTDPAVLLAQAAGRYTDSVHVAVQAHLGAQRLHELDAAAERALPGLTGQPAYPALRSQLALLAAAGQHPAVALHTALQHGDLNGAADPAAVLHRRLTVTQPADDEGLTRPLPWLPAVPAALTADPTWAQYLHEQHQQVRQHAQQVDQQTHGWTAETSPPWAAALLAARTSSAAPDRLVARLAIWRAVQQIPGSDQRPTGPTAPLPHEHAVQRSLDFAVRAALHDTGSSGTWRDLAEHLQPGLAGDPAWPRLADRLTALQSAGHDVPDLLRRALEQRSLPDEMPAAALTWRLPFGEPRHQPGEAEPQSSSDHPAPAAANLDELVSVPRTAPVPGTAPAPAGTTVGDAVTNGPGTASVPTTQATARAAAKPAEAWHELAAAIDPRLVAGADWPGLAAALERADRVGYDVRRHLRRLAAQDPLPDLRPAQALHYRLVGECDAAITPLPTRLRLADDSRARRDLAALAPHGEQPRSGRPPVRGPAR